MLHVRGTVREPRSRLPGDPPKMPWRMAERGLRYPLEYSSTRAAGDTGGLALHSSPGKLRLMSWSRAAAALAGRKHGA